MDHKHRELARRVWFTIKATENITNTDGMNLIETALNEVAQEGGWISVEKRLPLNRDKVPFLSSNNPGQHYGFFSTDRIWECYLCGEPIEDVTLWFDVPAPPTASTSPQEETGKETT